MKAYGDDFYTSRDEKTQQAANVVLSVLMERIPPIHSAIDAGCGVGTWLAVLKEKGVKDILGIDGNWVDQNLLVIPKDCFQPLDLSMPFTLPRRYDLAISCEVAEHLPSNRAEGFVRSLAQLSDFVLFSAAIPFQPGSNHINTQWQDYWVKLFAVLDYVVCDFIRPIIWNDGRIPYWYRQNTLLFTKGERLSALRFDTIPLNSRLPLNVVHPDLYLMQISNQTSVMGSYSFFHQSLRNYLKRKLLKCS